MTIIQKAALAAMQAAQHEAKDAREERNDRRSKIVKARVKAAHLEQHAGHRDVKDRVPAAWRQFAFSFAGGLGNIINSGYDAVAAEGGYETAALRRDARTFTIAADTAEAAAENAASKTETLKSEQEKAADQALSSLERLGTAVKIA